MRACTASTSSSGSARYPTRCTASKPTAESPRSAILDAARPAIEALAAWFADPANEPDLPLAPRGTPFQQRVWERLREIPSGSTTSYGEIALEIGRPGAARAVGGAVGRNPLSLIVPCHRVVAADGSIGGFASGLDRKRWLLAHEGVEGYAGG